MENYELRINGSRSWRTNLKTGLAGLNFCLLILLLSTVSLAVTLSEYRKNIHLAKQSIDILLHLSEEKTNRAENDSYRSATLKSIRNNLPLAETVEFQGTTVETQNKWIADKLNAFEKEADSTKRNLILTELSERFGALEAKLDEIEKAGTTVRTKDEEKQKLAEILRRPEYQKPEERDETALQKMWREFREWLKKVFPRSKTPNNPSTANSQSLSYVLQFVIYGLVLAIIGFLIYRFVPFLLSRVKHREKKDKGVRVILGEQLSADESSHSLFSEAENLALAGNLRAAIRKGYIALLCELSDRKIIGLAQHKTNRDYLRDVRNRGELYQNMSGLTGSFERYWYGFTAADEQDWEEFRKKYKQTVSSK